ncbi:hypothetical protein [Planktosalinus lacus]|uniref:Uncharacterized protein n=1 Tax=Planktosalinus lacus TaxID=1526573 RepID=A0A8J2V8G9_9FLAO|nr:hypothetical protein [Planktosalinus lacus]GGD82158.1 hypothetical protein GCM10011312_03120 [Planktosalinus lacus]
MKYFKILLSVIALALLVYNVTMIDFSNITEKTSIIAIIGVVACICVLLLLAILHISQKIEKKVKERK